MATKTLLFLMISCGTIWAFADGALAERASHRVAAVYFHRTQRCPTCKKISAYAEEAIREQFARETKEGRVTFHQVDFQDRENRKLTDFYKITGPTLVVVDVHNGKVAAWKPMPKAWSLIAKKDDFFKYVQQGIRGYLEEK